ncbi:sensor histidine kinase [Ilumatobacter nonamiensis]|uniref:sensor histidine kinase n=1 Tax=Ilumatobacter nonamiensis TaxID=467093 RepID=UPI000349FF51|nr:sensor histidine kinase [Ilumatobacter nonamiensis]
MVNPLRPWTRPGPLFGAIAYVAVGLPVGIIAFTITVIAIALSIGLMPAFLLGIPVGWVGLMVSRGLAHVERSRAGAFAAPIADSVAPLTRETWFGRLAERLRSKARWREIAHHLVSLPVNTLSYAVVAAAWCGASAMTLLPAYVDAIPDETAKFYFFEIGVDPPARWIALAVGVVGLVVVAPWVTIGAATAQWTIADRMLGPTDDERLAAQVAALRTSRTAAVDSAEAERRRIERDLHDGAQQRLVALAANLGAARDKLDDDPEAGRDMVDAAHEEAKAALGEIRDLVRGIHPVILEDRGIDAALSAVVARSPVPVALDVQIAERPPAAVESATYFVVTEALANVARHSGASRAYVSIARAADRLVVEIRDDGHGGADASKGTGLQGMRERVAGMGGTTHVISPEGGPTTISVEMPCGS